MGWSCTQKAWNTFQATIKKAQADWKTEQTNTWRGPAGIYFYETGPEQEDQGIKFEVMKMSGAFSEHWGYIKISPEGKILRWSGMAPKNFVEK